MRTIETTAIYEDGVLRPSAPLAIAEHTSVRVSVQVPTPKDATEHSRQVDEALVRAGLLNQPGVDAAPLPAPLAPERREELERLFSAGRPLSELIVEERETS